MQNAPDTLLTLIAPTALEEPLADLLIAMPELAHGFTCGPVEGRGVNVPLVGADESVRGRGKRVRIDIALDSAAREPLLEALRTALPGARIFHWSTSLLDCGRLW